MAGSAPTPDAAGSDADGDDDGRYLRREAAHYSRRLRETEEERDQLRERWTALQRAEVERLAYAAGMVVAGDLWTHGTTLDKLRNDPGTLTPTP